MKLLLIVAILGGLIWFFFIRKSSKVSEKKERQYNNQKKLKADHTMVECAKCGVYIATDEAIVSGGKYYCSHECLRS